MEGCNKALDINNLSPVLISVYDRLDCLKNAIAYLKKNPLSKYTSLYIVSDYAYCNEHIEIIQEIREYINSLSGFKRVEGIFWDKNKGSFDSVFDAVSYIFSKYDRLIIFEDDILVSNRFLEYMNMALEFYKDDKRIMSIASHTHYKNIIYKSYPHDVYLLKMYSPWGSGIWKDRFESIDFSLSGVDKFLNDKEQLREFNSISRHMLPILLDMLQKGKKYGDVMVCFNMFKQKRFTLYPIKPLSVNRGWDGRGEHCGTDKYWQNQELVNDFCPKMLDNIKLDSKIAKNAYKAFYSFKRDLLEVALKKLRLYTLTRKIYKILKGDNNE